MFSGIIAPVKKGGEAKVVQPGPVRAPILPGFWRGFFMETGLSGVLYAGNGGGLPDVRHEFFCYRIFSGEQFGFKSSRGIFRTKKI